MENGILHVDMNNFYASVETLFAPQYRDVPMAVAGDKESRHGIILAKKHAGQGAGGSRRRSPSGRLCAKCPDLQLVPPHHRRYAEFSRLAQKIYYDYTDRVEPFGLDECWLDVYGSQRLFGDGEEIAQAIRQRVKAELGLTVSVGVSFNKVFAKLGSDYKKPDAVTVFGRDKMESVIWQLPAGDMLLVGPTTQRTLAKYGVATIGDIARLDVKVLSGCWAGWGRPCGATPTAWTTSPVRKAGPGRGGKNRGQQHPPYPGT